MSFAGQRMDEAVACIALASLASFSKEVMASDHLNFSEDAGGGTSFVFGWGCQNGAFGKR